MKKVYSWIKQVLSNVWRQDRILVRGSISDLPSGLMCLFCQGHSIVISDLSDLPNELTRLFCSGSNIITGGLAGSSSGLTYFNCYDFGTRRC